MTPSKIFRAFIAFITSAIAYAIIGLGIIVAGYGLYSALLWALGE